MFLKSLRKKIYSKQFHGLLYWLSLITLGASVTYWAALTALLHAGNADQLVGSLLFNSPSTMQLPGAHTFLFKLPLFFAINLVGNSALAFVLATVFVTWATVGVFAVMLRHVEKRHLVRACIFFIMSGVLMLIPLEPRAGSLLPLNMAMIATRNLEYVLFIAALFWLFSAKSFYHVRMYIAIALLGVVIASDKLFLLLLAGATLPFVAIACMRRTSEYIYRAKVAALGLLGGAVSGYGLLWLLTSLNILHIADQQNTTPYQIAASVKGFAYGLMHVFTNFGANPLYEVGFGDMKSQLMQKLLRPETLGYVINAVFMLVVLWAVYVAIKRLIQAKKYITAAEATALALVGSTLAAWAGFAATEHFYVVDGRYLGVWFFAAFVILVTFLRRQKLRKHAHQNILLGGIVMAVLAVCVGAVAVERQFEAGTKAMSQNNERTMRIASMVEQKKVRVLIGDYWRVEPVKAELGGNITTVPMENCETPRTILTNAKFEKVYKNPFAILVTQEPGLTGFPACSVQQMEKIFGAPNRQLVVEGSLKAPKEILLFYDGRSNTEIRTITNPLFDTTQVTLSEYQSLLPKCPGGTTMNIMAHQDDDLLFMSPDIQRDADKKTCLRNIYLTAGDSAGSREYWLGRQLGAQSAHAKMRGMPNVWYERRVALPGGSTVSVTTQGTTGEISLFFFNIPDGNVNGTGFKPTGNQSLDMLLQDKLKSISTVDGLTKYTERQLQAALKDIINTFNPSAIRTHSDDMSDNQKVHDHSDHLSAAIMVNLAISQTQTKAAVTYYKGYIVSKMPINLHGVELEKKSNIFYEYAHHDGATCASQKVCKGTNYELYLPRQYAEEYHEAN